MISRKLGSQLRLIVARCLTDIQIIGLPSCHVPSVTQLVVDVFLGFHLHGHRRLQATVGLEAEDLAVVLAICLDC